ncbi:hypothetical protein D3C72_1437580 [compost metagenome]
MAAQAVAGPLRELRQHAHGGHVAGHHVDDRRLHLARLAVGQADQAHQAGIRLHDAVDAGAARIWSLLPVGGDRAVDQRGVGFSQLCMAEPEAFHYPRAHALHHDVGARDQAACHGHAVGGLEVERHAQLVAVEAVEQRAVVAEPAGAQPAAKLAAGRLHLDDPGAHVGQQHGAGRPGADLGEVDDGQAVQCVAQHVRSPEGCGIV